jgi:hypothetical protein
VASPKTRKRVTGTIGTAAAGGGFFLGLSHVAPVSLAVLGATLIVLALVLGLIIYRVLDRLLRHLERQPREASEESSVVVVKAGSNKRTPA